MRLARIAFQIEILQNGLRKKIIQMVKISAKGEFDDALALSKEYLQLLERERNNAEEAIRIVKNILSNSSAEGAISMKRKEVSEYLAVSMDTLRNWEMNGLLNVKRMQNGYRIYTENDIKRLKIIRSLRCANYSQEAILRLLHHLSQNPNTDIRSALNTPRQTDDIISACDRLIASLAKAEKNTHKIINILQSMKTRFS